MFAPETSKTNPSPETINIDAFDDEKRAREITIAIKAADREIRKRIPILRFQNDVCRMAPVGQLTAPLVSPQNAFASPPHVRPRKRL